MKVFMEFELKFLWYGNYHTMPILPVSSISNLSLRNQVKTHVLLMLYLPISKTLIHFKSIISLLNEGAKFPRILISKVAFYFQFDCSIKICAYLFSKLYFQVQYIHYFKLLSQIKVKSIIAESNAIGAETMIRCCLTELCQLSTLQLRVFKNMTF